MPRFPIAHVREQGVNLIIVPLDNVFGVKTRAKQNETINALQEAATSAGLAGTVVPVWESPTGQMAFIAPTRWHPFFKSIDVEFVRANLNRELFW